MIQISVIHRPQLYTGLSYGQTRWDNPSRPAGIPQPPYLYMLGRPVVGCGSFILLLYCLLMSDHLEREQIDQRIHEHTLYPPPERLTSRQAHLGSRSEYDALQEASHLDRSAYWLKLAKERLSWHKQPTIGFSGDFATGKVEWFKDGQLNVAENCIDRHAAAYPEKVAILWEGDEPADNRRITFRELLKMTSQLAHFMRSRGIQKGDRVTIYMPMVPETAAVMLACARIGAVHNVVFAGFSAESLADRINDSHSRLIVTADEGVRGGKRIPLKKTVDAAIDLCTDVNVSTVLVYQRTFTDNVVMKDGRDFHWNSHIKDQPEFIDAVSVEAEHPLFMLYTSGSTGKPKGLVHTTAGYLLYTSITQQYSFDYHDGDVFGCLADVGWITGHSYIVYGPLCNGATTVMFESIPTYPNASRYWDVVERLKINQLYTAPTVIRALKKFGDGPLEGFDLSSLRVLGTVGEPINPDAWIWYYEKVGRGRCAVVDSYWQTETGGHVVVPMPGAIPTKAGSATLPFPGITINVIDQHTGKTLNHSPADGVLVISTPWPGMARTIHGDHEKFFKTYFASYPGHYFSGDRVYRDADGYYWIRGRVDDVINVSGHRLSTAEIESALGRHRFCAEAAVLGRPDEITGQSIWAFCIIKPGGAHTDPTLLERELINSVREHIGAFAAPRRVIITEDLPKTRSGKIMRRVIRKILEGVRDVSALGDITTLNNPSIVGELINLVDAADKRGN